MCIVYKTGVLACLDGYMNIAMEQTEEYVNGQLKNKYGDAFIRGNNVLYISTSKRTVEDGAWDSDTDMHVQWQSCNLIASVNSVINLVVVTKLEKIAKVEMELAELVRSKPRAGARNSRRATS